MVVSVNITFEGVKWLPTTISGVSEADEEGEYTLEEFVSSTQEPPISDHEDKLSTAYDKFCRTMQRMEDMLCIEGP